MFWPVMFGWREGAPAGCGEHSKHLFTTVYTTYMYLIIQGHNIWISKKMAHYCFLAMCNMKGSLQVSHTQNNFLLLGTYLWNIQNHNEHYLCSKINTISKVQKRTIKKLQNKSGYQPKVQYAWLITAKQRIYDEIKSEALLRQRQY
jgi:hypothetical protein